MRNLSLTGRSLLVILSSTVLLRAQDAQDVSQKIQALEQQTQKFLQDQKPQLAIPLLREIASLDPNNVNAQGNLGVLLFFQGNYAEAIPHMRTAMQLQPALWKVAALLGIAEKRTGDTKAAQSDLERAFDNLTDKKIQIQAGLELIEIHSASAQLDKALTVAARLQDLAPQDPQILFAAYQLSRQMMNQSLLSLMVAAPESAEMHLLMAGELGRQGDRTNAIAHFREAIRLNPMLPGVHFELAEQLRTSPDAALSAQAEDEYKAALKVNPYDELSWRQLAGVQASKGDNKTAEENYRKALALQPRDSEAKAGLAIALISLDRTQEAVPLLEEAIQLDPTNLAAHYRLSGLYRRAGRAADAQREMDAFQHYKDVKDKLGKTFKQLSAPGDRM